VCPEGYAATGDSGSGRGESIVCESIPEVHLSFGSAVRFAAKDDDELARGTATGVAGLVRGAGSSPLQLAMVFDGSAPSIITGTYGNKAFLSIRNGFSPASGSSSVTEGTDGTTVVDVVDSASGSLVKPVAGSIVTAGVDVQFSLELTMTSSAAGTRSLNYEDIPADSRDFSFRVVVQGGACSPGSEFSQVCIDSDQSTSTLSFRAVDQVDSPQLAIGSSSVLISEQAQIQPGGNSVLRLGSGLPIVQATLGSRLAPPTGTDTDTGGALITFATEDATQPTIVVTAELRLAAGAAGSPVDFAGINSLFSLQPVTLPAGTIGGAGTLSLPALSVSTGYGSVLDGYLRCNIECPVGLEIAITARALGQRTSAISPTIVLPLTVENRPEPPRLPGTFSPLSLTMLESATFDDPISDTNQFSIWEPDAGDLVSGCTVDDNLFVVTIAPVQDQDVAEWQPAGLTGSIRVAPGKSLDFETQTRHNIQITCSDESGLTSEIYYGRVDIADVFENRAPFAPTVVGQEQLSFFEGPMAGSRVQGALSVGDPDEGDLSDLTVTVVSCDGGTDDEGVPLCPIGS